MRLLKLTTAVLVLWSLYWLAAGYGLRSGITGWFDTQAQRGWQAEYANVSSGGYPTRHVTRLAAPALADPATGLAWSADWLSFESPAIWPGRQVLRVSPDAQRISFFDRTSTIFAADLEARLDLAPGLALELRELALEGAAWRIQQDGADVVAADTLHLQMIQTETPETYRMGFEAAGFRPGVQIRQVMGAAKDVPDQFEALVLDVDVQFDTIWDRGALEQRRPQPRHIDLKRVEAQWGPMRLKAAGALDVDEAGIPSGAVNLKAENWRDMIEMAEFSGALPASAVDSVVRVLGMLAGLGGNPEDLDIQINFRDGFVAFGPLPLGPAPRLIIR
ncbi:MAG: DUF2125 domain-containing protein [Rhodobacteraceae bacterium]|nr:DUF2125 domain-containing protein [Paracoccaceae bacterium]